MGVCHDGPQKVWPKPRKNRAPKGGGHNITRFFSLSPAPIFALFVSLSLGVLSLNFGGVFEGRDPQMCTFGLSGCRVKPRRVGHPGLTNFT